MAEGIRANVTWNSKSEEVKTKPTFEEFKKTIYRVFSIDPTEVTEFKITLFDSEGYENDVVDEIEYTEFFEGDYSEPIPVNLTVKIEPKSIKKEKKKKDYDEEDEEVKGKGESIGLSSKQLEDIIEKLVSKPLKEMSRKISTLQTDIETLKNSEEMQSLKDLSKLSMMPNKFEQLKSVLSKNEESLKELTGKIDKSIEENKSELKTIKEDIIKKFDDMKNIQISLPAQSMPLQEAKEKIECQIMQIEPIVLDSFPNNNLIVPIKIINTGNKTIDQFEVKITDQTNKECFSQSIKQKLYVRETCLVNVSINSNNLPRENSFKFFGVIYCKGIQISKDYGNIEIKIKEKAASQSKPKKSQNDWKEEKQKKNFGNPEKQFNELEQNYEFEDNQENQFEGNESDFNGKNDGYQKDQFGGNDGENNDGFNESLEEDFCQNNGDGDNQQEQNFEDNKNNQDFEVNEFDNNAINDNWENDNNFNNENFEESSKNEKKEKNSGGKKKEEKKSEEKKKVEKKSEESNTLSKEKIQKIKKQLNDEFQVDDMFEDALIEEAIIKANGDFNRAQEILFE